MSARTEAHAPKTSFTLEEKRERYIKDLQTQRKNLVAKNKKLTDRLSELDRTIQSVRTEFSTKRALMPQEIARLRLLLAGHDQQMQTLEQERQQVLIPLQKYRQQFTIIKQTALLTREEALPVLVTVREWDPLCVYCPRDRINPSTTIDHLWPKSLLGPFTFLNLLGACKSCNSAKGDKTVREAGMTLHLPRRFFEPFGVPRELLRDPKIRDLVHLTTKMPRGQIADIIDAHLERTAP